MTVYAEAIKQQIFNFKNDQMKIIYFTFYRILHGLQNGEPKTQVLTYSTIFIVFCLIVGILYRFGHLPIQFN